MPILILIALIVAIMWHALLTRVVWATMGAMLTSTFFIWVFTQSHFGWMNKIFLENLLLTVTVALISALLVGAFFQRGRKARAVL